MSDEFEDLREISKKVVDILYPKINDSDVFAALVTDSYFKDALCATQLGLAILLDKPIALIVDKTVKLPSKLIKVANKIDYVDMKNEEDINRASQSLYDFVNSLKMR